jgi:hypothetical protein
MPIKRRKDAFQSFFKMQSQRIEEQDEIAEVEEEVHLSLLT